VVKQRSILSAIAWLILTSACLYAQTQSTPAKSQVITTLPYKDGIIVLTSDEQGVIGKKRYATGHVKITYQTLAITCDQAEFDETTRQGTTSGATKFVDGLQWFTCSRSEFNLEDRTATLYDAAGYTDAEFLVQGRMVLKTGSDTYQVAQASLTSCQESRPKWSFAVSNANIHLDQTAQLRRVLFKVKGVPVFYFPYLVVPLESKKRSSGFLPFHTGSSSTKGRRFNLGYYQTLGRSADLTLYEDYFSLRGLGIGGEFRATPNEHSVINIQAFGVNDRMDQGGAHLIVDAHTLLNNGFETAAKINITTNFKFRQAFSEGLRSATIPEEQALVYASRNFDSFSAGFSFERNEVFFPGRSLVIRKSPSLEFVSLGKSLGKLPLIFSFRGAAEGMYRLDSSIETPRVVQRLDFFPRVALRLPSFAGFSLVPTIGVRETYYSAHLSGSSDPDVIATPLRRQYWDLDVDLRTPQLERPFHFEHLGDFRHSIEPVITYRRISGIRALDQTLRFDDQDAIADTHEVEYGIVNRIMRSKEASPGKFEYYEWMALRVVQKYYFDPTFGGSFRPNEVNTFYPLNTISGFSSTGIQRTLSPTQISLRINTSSGFSTDFRADYDTRLGRLRDSSLWGMVRHNKILLAGTYVKTNAVESSMFSADHVQAQIQYSNPNTTGFSTDFIVSYNIRTRSFLNSNSRLNYVWNCCGVSLEFQQYDLGVRNETRFTFSFSLKGIGSFGNMKRPDVIF
jgi:LPS-assembly protein